MANGRDATSFLKIIDAPGSVDNYFLDHLKGMEALSIPFLFTLHLRSRGEIPAPGDWIGASITFGMGASDSDMRSINGQCVRIERSFQKDAYVEFELDVAPAFVMAKQRRDCRIFTDQTAKDIIETILAEHEMDFDTSAIIFVDTVREYCVQYWETDFDFCCRLMEEEGIFYYFLYDPSAGQYQHTMYLADNESGYFDGSTYEISFAKDLHDQGLTSIDLQHMQYTDSWVTHDYNYKAPTSLTPIRTATRFDYSTPGTKFYEWPGKYDSMDHGQRDSRFGMQLAESASVIMSGVGTYMCFMPGARFDIVDKRLDPGQRLIAVRSLEHECHNPFNADEGGFFYTQTFSAVPSTEPFHPPRTTPKAVVQGPQTAVVVDQVDPEGFGRVKVQFHWDTAGTQTCWLRLAQQWAGDQIGAQWIPRVGWEVLVAFLEGDPDRPVVIGGLYNADNMYPFPVPANLSQSGWRTRTYPQGDITAEFIFEDKDGAEEVYLYGGRNYRREIVKDELSTIGEYRRTTVGKDQSLDIGGSSATTIKDDDSLKVGKDQTIKIDGKSDISIGDDASVKIGGDQSIEVDGDSDVTVQGDCSVEIDGDFDIKFKSDADADVSKDLTIKVDGEVSLKGSKTVDVDAKSDVTIKSDTNITLQVGGSKVEISPDGVTISGSQITIKGSNVTITGSMVKIN